MCDESGPQGTETTRGCDERVLSRRCLALVYPYSSNDWCRTAYLHGEMAGNAGMCSAANTGPKGVVA